jgi:SNW domain-containing protein 1
MFERDNGDPFGVEQMIADAQSKKGGDEEAVASGSASVAGQGVKRYGLNEGGEREERGSKRARIEDDDE